MIDVNRREFERSAFELDGLEDQRDATHN